jgi:hypothetical protein
MLFDGKFFISSKIGMINSKISLDENSMRVFVSEIAIVLAN